MAERVKTQPNRALEIYVGGKLIAKAIGECTITTDRPLTDVPAYGMRFPNSVVAGMQTFEITMDIIAPPTPIETYKQLLQSFIVGDDLDDIFDVGGIYEGELPYEDILDQIPMVVIAEGADSRLLDTGTPINDVITPTVVEVYYGMTVRQLMSQLSLGEAHFKRNLVLKPTERKIFQGPIAIDTFNRNDKLIESGVECGFRLSATPIRLIDGQYVIVLVNNEIWRKGFYYHDQIVEFDEPNGYCPDYPIALFLREEQVVVGAAVTLDNVPMNNGEVVTNEYDTEKYVRVGAGAEGIGDYSIAGAVLTFNAGDNGQIIHADYFSQNANVPFHNITIIYTTTKATVKAGDAFSPLRGDMSA